MGSNPHFLLRPDPSARHFSQPPAENRSTHIYTRLPPSHTPTALRPRALWGCGKHPSALARRPPRGIYRAETPRRGEPKFSSPTPTALCPTARGYAVSGVTPGMGTTIPPTTKWLCRGIERVASPFPISVRPPPFAVLPPPQHRRCKLYQPGIPPQEIGR